ncbi:MAG: lipopolysaccharide biosynthesis protein RfbH [Pseudomonadota bacterium]
MINKQNSIVNFNETKRLSEIRSRIRFLVAEFSRIKYQETIFVAGDTPIPPSGKLLGVEELSNLVDSSLDGWLTTGRFNDAFECELKKYLNSKYVLTTNSGSSANLLALSALTSPKLGDKALKLGDEVIAVAAGFPTTVNPILQCGLIPVFVDVELETYNIDTDLIETAISDKTRAIMIAHTLGNPFNIEKVLAIAQKYNLWVIEDTCDALGSTYTVNNDITTATKIKIKAGEPRLVGTFGHIGTLSFYPAHHITMGEGGAVFTDSKKLQLIIESMRDWGRDCYCDPGHDNTCNKRFEWSLGELPEGYDHKYIYSHLGYNLKITDMQASCGLAQLKKLDMFIQQRKNNFLYLKTQLKSCEKYLILPEATVNSDPSWFGFAITLRDNSPISRVELLKKLDHYNIGSRLLFAGNVTCQPYMKDRKYRISGSLINTDKIMHNTFWIGVQPALVQSMLDYIVNVFEDIFLT